ncbi:MAG: hypothetical protein JO352_27400 [Chloroflexi bacterium]|nr:hypothetical protein [Chloroflexota bacterium]MBV9602102.1 hypothetical protein [Chloroflexota bacterium]
MTAASLHARDDLITAAMSMQRLGTLTSGMWCALSRELATAAERLERESDEHVDSLYRRARALDVDPDAVLEAGIAAGHLDEHRETLERVLATLDEDVRRLAAPDVLLGFSVDDEVLLREEQLEEDEVDTSDDSGVDAGDEAGEAADDAPLAIHVWLFVWPAPLRPARVRIVPELAVADADAEPESDLSVSFSAIAPEAVVDALSSTCGLPGEGILPALSGLGLACWSAHQADEHGDDDDDDDANEADQVDDE